MHHRPPNALALWAPARADPILGPPQSPDEIGRLGSYRVLAELGRGGMGVVYRAEDPRLERQVALKALLPELAADPRAKARFVREARAQAQVEHDHVTPIHAVEEAQSVTFIVMPLLKGQTLAAALKLNPRPPLGELVRIGREIAEGLAAAHAAGLVHRDIKPGNVWLEGNTRRVKILDFGLAHNADGRRGVSDPQADGFAGTPAYAAPEQARLGPTDHRTDLFSLGAVLYQMLTGRLPFTGPSIADILNRVTACEPPPVETLVPDAPPALAALVRRLMAKNPAHRPQSAEAVAADLDAISRAYTSSYESDPWEGIDTINPDAVTVVQVPRPESAEPERRSRWPKLAALAGGVVVLALAVAAAVEVWPKPPREPNPTPTSDKATGPQPRPPEVKEKPKAPPAAPDRQAAEALAGHANLTVRVAGAHEIVIRKGDRLPTDPFVVTGVELVGDDFPPDFADRVLLPAAERFPSLVVVSGWGARMPELTDVQLSRLAATPAGAALTELKIAPGPALTRGTLAALKKFPNLRSVSLGAATADDELLKGLAELKLSDFLGLTECGSNPDVTDAGLRAVAALPLKRLTLANSPAAPALVRVVSDGAKYDELNLWYSPVTDTDLSGLARCRGVGRLVLRGTKVTNAGLEHLPAVRGLASVDLTNTGVTATGVEKLRAALPNCRIEWDGSVIEPKKP